MRRTGQAPCRCARLNSNVRPHGAQERSRAKSKRRIKCAFTMASVLGCEGIWCKPRRARRGGRGSGHGGCALLLPHLVGAQRQHARAQHANGGPHPFQGGPCGGGGGTGGQGGGGSYGQVHGGVLAGGWRVVGSAAILHQRPEAPEGTQAMPPPRCGFVKSRKRVLHCFGTQMPHFCAQPACRHAGPGPHHCAQTCQCLQPGGPTGTRSRR